MKTNTMWQSGVEHYPSCELTNTYWLNQYMTYALSGKASPLTLEMLHQQYACTYKHKPMELIIHHEETYRKFKQLIANDAKAKGIISSIS